MCLPLVVTQRNLLWYIVLIWGTWTRTFRSFPWINHNVILLQPAHTHNQEQQHNNIQHFFNIIYPAVNFPVIGKVESCKYFVWVWDTQIHLLGGLQYWHNCEEYLRMCLPLLPFSLPLFEYLLIHCIIYPWNWDIFFSIDVKTEDPQV